MNAEISRIRKTRNNSEIFEHKPIRLDFDRVNDLTYQLNANFGELYMMVRSNDINIDEFVKRFTMNLYIVLNMFDEMGVYPDYFFDEIVKMNIEYKKLANDQSIRGNYQLFKNVNLSARVSEAIKKGLEKGYYRIQSYPKKDVNENFLEIVGFFESFNIPYNINTKEQCVKVFSALEHNHVSIIESFINDDDIVDDIEYLSRLLFEYMTFFVSMGIYPKEHLDKYIESIETIHDEENKPQK